MKVSINHFSATTRTRGFTLVEFMVAMGISSLLLTAVALMGIYGSRAFAGMGNYSDLDNQSRNALDMISAELRECSAVLAFKTNLPVRSITLTNDQMQKIVKLEWDSDDRTLVMAVTGDEPRVMLKDCDRWDFRFFNRAPKLTSTNFVFYPATNAAGALIPARCKLIDMSWKCSRTVLGNPMNTESMQTAQIVLRNKVR